MKHDPSAAQPDSFKHSRRTIYQPDRMGAWQSHYKTAKTPAPGVSNRLCSGFHRLVCKPATTARRRVDPGQHWRLCNSKQHVHTPLKSINRITPRHDRSCIAAVAIAQARAGRLPLAGGRPNDEFPGRSQIAARPGMPAAMLPLPREGWQRKSFSARLRTAD